MPVLAEHTVATVHRQETFDVRGGGGMVQPVPWNLPADGNVHFSDGLGDSAVFGGLGALTDVEIQQLAERIKRAAAYPAEPAAVQAILEIVPTTAERQAVASRAAAIGADPAIVQQALAALERGAGLKTMFKPPSMPVRIVWGVLSTASFAASIYHGYKRNNSLGWGIWWGFMGALFPVVTPTIAFAQGFGKAKKNGLGRSYRRRGRKSRRS